MEKTVKIIASKHFSNTGGIGIINFEFGADDFVIFAVFTTDGIAGRIRRSKVRHTRDGRAYFMGCNARQYLDEFI
jgi:hypothetical protein